MDKKRERTHLEHFKEICGFFPDGEIECTERPDFIVHGKDKSLGIEHTNIFQLETQHGSILQAKDKLNQKVVNQARDLYLQNHYQPLLVQITFNPNNSFPEQEIKQLAEMISRIIERTPITPGLRITLKRTHENFEYFPIEIARIYLNSYPNGKENRWISSSSGVVQEFDIVDLQKKINSKDEFVDIYRSRCSEVWLLIVADYARIPTTLDISSDATIHRYQTKFDRVFFFWNAIRYFIELQLTRYSF
jgi:hypothetical protein